MTAHELYDLLEHALMAEGFTLVTIPPLVARLAALQNALMAHWSLLQAAGQPTGSPVHDKLLDIDQAAARLNVSVDYLYRNGARLPFTVRVGRLLRFSANGIDDYIRQGRNRKGK